MGKNRIVGITDIKAKSALELTLNELGCAHVIASYSLKGSGVMRIQKINSYFKKGYKRGGMKSVINLFYSYLTVKREPLVVKSWPATLIIEPTTKCNLHCVMCDEKLRSRTTKDLTIEEFVRIIDQFPYVQKLAIQGVGEPTLNKDFYKMIRYAKAHGIWTYFNTNCTTLTKLNIEKMIDASPDEIRLSLDSLTKDVYEEIRVGAAFERVISNIKKLAASCRDKPVMISLWLVLMNKNVNELVRFIKFCKDSSIRRLIISSPQDWGNEELANVIKDIKVNNVALSILHDIENQVEEKAKEYDVEVIWSPKPSKAFMSKVKKRECQWPWYSAYVTVEGFITPCCGQGSNPNIINFGNILHDKFESIWNSQKYIEFRKQLKSSTPPKICLGCPSYTDGGVKLRF